MRTPDSSYGAGWLIAKHLALAGEQARTTLQTSPLHCVTMIGNSSYQHLCSCCECSCLSVDLYDEAPSRSYVQADATVYPAARCSSALKCSATMFSDFDVSGGRSAVTLLLHAVTNSMASCCFAEGTETPWIYSLRLLPAHVLLLLSLVLACLQIGKDRALTFFGQLMIRCASCCAKPGTSLLKPRPCQQTSVSCSRSSPVRNSTSALVVPL